MTDLKKLFGQLNDAIGTIKNEIHGLDDQIKAKHKAKSEIMAAPVSKEDYLWFMEQEIKGGHNGFETRLSRELRKQPRGLPQLIRSNESPFFRGHILVPAHENFTLYYFADLILEGVKKAVDTWEDWPENAVPYKDRMILASKIDEEIAVLDKQRDELAKQLLELNTSN
jgi:hypothetical protein